MKYNFMMNFVTDGDYGFSLIPPSMRFDGEDYYLSKDFEDFKSLKEYINWIVPVLSEQLTGRGTEVKTLKEKFCNLLSHVNSEDGESNYSFYLSGNYDGTQVGYYMGFHVVNCYLYFNDDVYEKYVKANLSYKDVYDAILEAINKHLKEDE